MTNTSNKMKFKSQKDLFFSIIILGTSTFLTGVSLSEISNQKIGNDDYWAFILVFAVVGLLLWLYFGTHYELSKEDGLIYRSGPFNGKISVNRITEIVRGKTLWIGFRPATSRKGLIIKYDQYNEIYISPKTNESFIKKILELNSAIKITE